MYRRINNSTKRFRNDFIPEPFLIRRSFTREFRLCIEFEAVSRQFRAFTREFSRFIRELGPFIREFGLCIEFDVQLLKNYLLFMFNDESEG